MKHDGANICRECSTKLHTGKQRTIKQSNPKPSPSASPQLLEQPQPPQHHSSHPVPDSPFHLQKSAPKSGTQQQGVEPTFKHLNEVVEEDCYDGAYAWTNPYDTRVSGGRLMYGREGKGREGTGYVQ